MRIWGKIPTCKWPRCRMTAYSSYMRAGCRPWCCSLCLTRVAEAAVKGRMSSRDGYSSGVSNLRPSACHASQSFQARFAPWTAIARVPTLPAVSSFSLPSPESHLVATMCCVSRSLMQCRCGANLQAGVLEALEMQRQRLRQAADGQLLLCALLPLTPAADYHPVHKWGGHKI